MNDTRSEDQMTMEAPVTTVVQKEDRGGKYLTFFLAAEEYGLEILKVQEIIGIMPITRVPHVPYFIRGVINLRGKIIPVVDLRLKFGMESIDETDETCIIVAKTQDIEMGVIVDRVSEVRNIITEDIDDSPSFGAEMNTDYILGIGKSEGGVKILLDIEMVLSSDEIIELQSTTAENGRPPV